MADTMDDEHLEKPPDPQSENNPDNNVHGAVNENIKSNQEVENMEVHHHAHHTHEKRSWKSYFWEFLMLFLAVTLGFFVENQREHYIENVRAREFSKSLIHDLKNDIVAIQSHKKTATMYNTIADSLLILSQKRLEGRAASQFSFYTRFMYWTGPIIWNRATFEQIKNSGSLRYFKNQELLEKLMKYEALINIIEMEAYNRQVRGNMMVEQINQILDPLYHQELSRYFLVTYDSIPAETIKNLYTANLEPLENKRKEIREFLNMVVVQQRNIRWSIDTDWKEADELAIVLINDLEKEYRH